MVIWHNSKNMEKALDSVREIMVVAEMREVCEADVTSTWYIYLYQIVT